MTIDVSDTTPEELSDLDRLTNLVRACNARFGQLIECTKDGRTISKVAASKFPDGVGVYQQQLVVQESL